ncbi:MAG TPA: type II toxin-antitoxin system VapC family toxin [Acidobacteriaceae bacterium]
MILLDTRAAIWLALSPERLSHSARAAIEHNAAGGLGLSAQSLFEVAWLVVRRRISPGEPIEKFIHNFQSRFHIFPMTPAIAIAAAQLPSSFPSDPFDRIISATAITEGLPLVTPETRIRRSRALRTIW